MAFPASTLYQAWVSRLRLPWLGKKGVAIMQAFAKVVGDLTIDWGTQANLEHLPEYASAPSVALIGSERQIDQGPAETTAAYATRLTQAVPTWKRAGSPLGLLLALHYAGFDNAVVVQSNGNAYQLTLPLNADVTTNLVVTSLMPNPQIQGSMPLAAGASPWWTFDAYGTDAVGAQWNSRFMVLFPLPTPAVMNGGSPTATNLALLRSIIAKWQPRKAVCVGITCVTQGNFYGWPIRTWGTNGATWGPHTNVVFSS